MGAWTDPDRWEGLRRGDGCPLCERASSAAESDADGIELRRSPVAVSWLLRREPRGRALVFARRHVVEPFDLPAEQAAAFFEEVQCVARGIDGLCRPVKLNYSITGNEVPHLCCEISPRYRDEATEPVGGEQALHALAAELRRRLTEPSGATPLRYEPLGMDDLPRLQELCESCADYYHLMTGTAVHPSEARSLFTMRPETAGVHDKFLIAVWRGPRMIGALDVYRNYPSARSAWIGLLLLHPELRGCGLGTEMISWVLGWARQQGCDRVRVGVAEDNQRALEVLAGLGFVPTGERILRVSGARRLVLRPLECRFSADRA